MTQSGMSGTDAGDGLEKDPSSVASDTDMSAEEFSTPGGASESEGPADAGAGDEPMPGQHDGGADGGAGGGEGPADAGAEEPATPGAQDGGADGGADGSTDTGAAPSQ